jgi:hypothetical protein
MTLVGIQKATNNEYGHFLSKFGFLNFFLVVVKGKRMGARVFWCGNVVILSREGSDMVHFMIL